MYLLCQFVEAEQCLWRLCVCCVCVWVKEQIVWPLKRHVGPQSPPQVNHSQKQRAGSQLLLPVTSNRHSPMWPAKQRDVTAQAACWVPSCPVDPYMGDAAWPVSAGQHHPDSAKPDRRRTSFNGTLGCPAQAFIHLLWMQICNVP